MHSKQTTRLYTGLDSYADLLGGLSTARGLSKQGLLYGTDVTIYIMFRGEVDPASRDWLSQICVILAYELQTLIYKYTQAVKHRLHAEI